MPWRPPSIYQSTSTPPSVTLSPDPPCSLHLASNLIDFLHKHLIFFLSSSTVTLYFSALSFFLLFWVVNITSSCNHSPFLFPLTVLQESAFQLSFDLYHQSSLIAPHTYLLNLTCKSVYMHASALQPHPPTSLDYKVDTRPGYVHNVDFSKWIHISK